jgi:hypothetical protein
MTKQAIIRFQHPAGTRSSSQWRQALAARWPAATREMACQQSASAFSLITLGPGSTAALQDDVMGCMRAVADTAGRTLDVEMLELTPAVSFTGHRWSYVMPRLVVAKGGDWEPWRAAQLADAQVEQLRARIDADLRRQLLGWLGEENPALDIRLEDVGRPMPLKGAISAPKPVTVMARLDVRFSSAKRLEGAFFCGHLAATGHGRVFRDGQQG